MAVLVDVLPQCTQLEVLDLSRVGLTPSVLPHLTAALANLPLKGLFLSSQRLWVEPGESEFTQQPLEEMVTQLSHLQELFLSGVGMRWALGWPSFTLALALRTSLTSLNLCNNPVGDLGAPLLMDALGGLPQLGYVDLSYLHLTAFDVAEGVRGLTQVTHLVLSRNPLSSTLPLMALTQLRGLSMRDSGLIRADWPALLPHLTRLERLSLPASPLSETPELEWGRLKGLTHLEYLQCGPAEGLVGVSETLTYLDLSETLASATLFVEQLKRWSKLETLMMAKLNCNTTDVPLLLESLQSLSQLKQVNISHLPVQDDHLSRFLATVSSWLALRWLNISHFSLTMCPTTVEALMGALQGASELAYLYADHPTWDEECHKCALKALQGWPRMVMYSLRGSGETSPKLAKLAAGLQSLLHLSIIL